MGAGTIGTKNGDAAGGGEPPPMPLVVNVYFCQRTFLLHDQLFESACRLVDEQIRLVNQELLLEKMHQMEECDPLLLDHETFGGTKGGTGGGGPTAHHHPHHGIGLDSVPQGSVATRSAQNVPGEALSRHSAGTNTSRFTHQNRPSSLLIETGQKAAAFGTIEGGGGVRHHQQHNPIASSAVLHNRNNSLTFSDEDEHSEVSELARYKFRPGHFACELVWHHWFPIHPRLQPSRAFGSSCNDIGFKALRLGLEGLAVRNRSNMYVYKEQNGNVVYMRLHCTEESILGNIPASASPGWEEEVRQHSAQCILLAVHGVRPPGHEITVQLKSVLQRRLNSRTLEEIQNALLKNAHIRLEWSDIRFIQKEPAMPSSVFFFTLPKLAQRHLGSIKYYLGQQMLTFCILPKFREQSGAAHHNHHHHYARAKYSNSSTNSRYFSGGGTSLALSLAGTPTIEQHSAQYHFRTEPSREMAASPAHSFVPFSMPEGPQNPPNYVPTFYLVNKPPGEGKRDTGIACLEVKLIDWEGRLVDQVEEGQLDAESHSLLFPGLPTPIDDPLPRAARLHELSRCIQVDNPLKCANPVPSTCALFQFNMWQNGNVGIEELQGRLKMCVQQAICDLVTEFGLLSNCLFESSATPMRSKAGSFSITANAPSSLALQQPQMLKLKPSLSELPISQIGGDGTQNAHLNAATPVGSHFPLPSSPVKALAANSAAVGQWQPQNQPNPLVKSDASPGFSHPICHPQPLRHPVTVPLLNRLSASGQQPMALGVGAASSSSSGTATAPIHRPLQSPIQFGQQQIQHPPLQQKPPPQNANNINTSGIDEFLRADFVLAADEWFSHVINETKGSPEMSHSVRKYQFRLDCDASARKIIQVISDRLKGLLKTERVIICRNSPSAGQMHEGGGAQRKRLQTLRSFTSLLDPVEKDMGRRVNSCRQAEPLEFALLALNEHLCQEEMVKHPTAAMALPVDSGASGTAGQSANLATKLADQSSLSKFLPCLRPFIPRQRLLYLLIHGETVSLFLYNYTNEVVAKSREIVERATLWHNARSRLLREIGLHKMGITHLSTLKSADAKYNSYLLLTWMDPETLIQNDYPVDSLTTPDFSNIPRIYAQLLLKLYRFADASFVAKHLSICPFEDQTQQMLTLREDVRSMLNDHRIYMEIHPELLAMGEKQETTMTEEVLARLVSHCHLVHFVETPILLFPSWRRKVAAIRVGSANLAADGAGQPCRKHSFQSTNLAQQPINGKAKGGGKPNQFPTTPSSSHSAVGAVGLRSSAAVGILDEDEPCAGRIQQMLLQDYTNYLRSIGLRLLHIQKVPEVPPPSPHPPPPPPPSAQQPGRHPSGIATAAAATPTIDSSPPEQWLCYSLEGGIIFVHLSFMAPFFCLRVLQWNAQPQLDEHLRPNQQQRRSCARRQDQQQSLRLLEWQKNQLVRRCHLHSFVYDFHLRMVARYLVGDRHFLFNPGYNTNAFLVDFLQYYGCRPPNARNCVYEEAIHCADLQVVNTAIWEHFLNNEQHYGWKVIRQKSTEIGQQHLADQFMLVAKERRSAFGLDYELIRVVINPPNPSPQKGGGNNTSRGEHHHQINLRLYVLLVTEMMAPFEGQQQQQQQSSLPPLPIPQSKSAADLQQQQQKADGRELSSSRKAFAPDGGEFTQINGPSNGGGHGHLMMMMMMGGGGGGRMEEKLSPCSTLVEQKEGGNGASTELESFGEEEEEEEEDDGEDAEGDINRVQFEGGGGGEESLLLEECKETRVVDKKGGGGQLQGESIFPVGTISSAASNSSSLPLPPLPAAHLHGRQPSTATALSSASSQQSLNLRMILPTKLSEPNYCYECVIAAAEELCRKGEKQQRKLTGGGGKQLTAGGDRQRFCSGGVLLAEPGRKRRRNLAARMSLPPSRTSTNSSSSVATGQQKGGRIKMDSSGQQRSGGDSSQLSASSSVNSLTKKDQSSMGMGTARLALTPANSLKGLSEWRASTAKSAAGHLECDWTLLDGGQSLALASGGGGQQKLAIQRNPPRRHRRGGGGLGHHGGSANNSFCMAMPADTVGRDKGAVVPAEQVTYLHYLSSHQRRLQHLLEEEVRANRLAQFVGEADRFCYIDMLWKGLLATRPSFQIPAQRAQSLFLSSTSSKSDMFSDTTSAFFGGRPSISSDLEPLDFEALLRVIGVESAADREPKLRELLHRLNWHKLCRFLIQFYEGEKRCRYFENSPYAYLVITNPQFLDSAAMFRHDFSTNVDNTTVELFLLFKQSSHSFDTNSGSFAANSIRKLVEEAISCICAFLWSNMLQNPPNLA